VIGRVADLPADLQQALGDRDLIVFDGECILCSGFFRFIVEHDRSARFHFALAQSDLGAAIYQALDLDTRFFETNIIIVDGDIHAKLGAFAAAMRAIGWPWRLLAWLSYVPAVVGDPAYHLIARNRYRIFGRYDACMLPDASIRARFMDTGWKAAA